MAEQDAPVVAPESTLTPIAQQGAVQNPPETTGLPTAEPLPATVQELVDAVSPPNSPPVSPGTPLVTTGVPGSKETPPAAPAAAETTEEAAAAPAEAPKDRWAELADRERALQQSRRAFDFQDQQRRNRAAQTPAEATGESAAEFQARLRADPSKALADAGIGLQDLADRVVAGPGDAETPEVRDLKAKIQQIEANQTQQAEHQTQQQNAYQYQQMHAGLMDGLGQAKESYPNLLSMLSSQDAATAILQGIQNSYNADTGVYTQDADTVAQGLETHLKGLGDRLIEGRQPPTEPGSPPSASAPNPDPRLNNQSTAAPQAAPVRKTRNDEIAAAAQLLTFTERE